MGENENGKDEAPTEKQAELADVPRHADFLRLALPAARWMASFVTVIVLTVLIDVLVAGFSRRCLTAILGSVAGTIVTCLSAWGLTILLKLDGGDLPYVVPLLSQSAMQVDTRSLYIGVMFLANSGALMDLSMDISVSMEEVHRHKPDISRRALMKSGMLFGRSVLGTMTTPLMDIINLKYVALQLLNTLVGSFGLAAAVPLTALIATGMYLQKPKPAELRAG